MSSVRVANAAGEEVRGELAGWGPGWSMSSSLGGTYVYSSGQVSVASDSVSEFKFYKNSSQWYGGGSVNFAQIYTNFSASTSANASFNHTTNKYYVFKWNGGNSGVVFQFSSAPASISGVTRNPAAPNSADTTTITVTTSSALPSEQAVWLRYTTNSFSTSTVVKLTGSGTAYTTSIPAQSAGTTVMYYAFTSGNVSSIAASDADLMAINYDINGGSNYSYVVASAPAPITPVDTKALWIGQSVIAWNGAAATSYKLLYDPDGGLMNTAESTAYTDGTSAGFINLTASGTVNGASYPKNPNANGMIQLSLPGGVTADQIKTLLKGQVVVASYDGSNTRIASTKVQIQGVLDALYASGARAQTLGVTYASGAPTAKVWAPTAKNVTLRRYVNSSTGTYTSHAMTLDGTSGVWSVTGDSSWDRQYYMFEVQVYVPSTDQVSNNLVTDPYAVSLSADGVAAGDVRSQFVNLDDADLKPSGWNSLSKPALAAPEDISIYELHVRDFSINDSSVSSAAHRGTFKAFSYDGNGGRGLSNGMNHLKQLQQAGLTHIHLLPVFDIATVTEKVGERTEPSFSFNPATDRASSAPQSAISTTRYTDGFNWGYDPYHYGVPEGSYATDPDGVTRILEFREMVQRLNENGLRVVMDVVYNHTAYVGQVDKSLLDQVVPGYYYRYDNSGTVYKTSCCPDTASEYSMMEGLMIDTLTRWAKAYKVDGFRFDLMNFHTKQNILNVQTALSGLTTGVDGVDGSKIYVYGEGWDFGSAATKGLTTCPNCYAKQYNMTNTGIGLFNDTIRDAAHGGFSTDTTEIYKQGFINGLSYDWNGVSYANRYASNLNTAQGNLRTTLAGSGDLFAGDPQETINYVEKHDNETLYDLNVFRLPSATSMADRVRAQNMGTSLIALAQGIPFFHAGQDTLRSKSLDRNSFESGDWFNKLDWTYGSNNFGRGLPPEWDNSGRWGIMTPLLNNTALDPASSNIQTAAAHLREMLRIRNSSKLFRLNTKADITSRVTFYNSDNAKPGMVVMALNDTAATDLDATYETILVFFNANKITQTLTIAGANGFSIHPLQLDATDADPMVAAATFNDSTDTFSIPARTTVVFVSNQTILPQSTIDWVGKMYPRGSVANQINQGGFTPSGLDIYVRVYDAGVTDGSGQGAGIACYLHWGKYGTAWADLPMTYNVSIGNDDEYKATIPQATINALGPGNYGFTAYCQRSGEDKKWKSDSYNIDGNSADDDQGDGLITIVPTADSAAEAAGSVFVHLFEWKWTDIEKECTYLGQKGYKAVQVSPPMEHVPPIADMGGADRDYPWWVRYQPVTHDTSKLTSRSGTLAEFQSMVNTCQGQGVSIIVDAVINHTTYVGSGTGTAGSSYTSYSYPQYSSSDFHACGTSGNEITDYSNRREVQTCELADLADLDTSKATVTNTLRTYLQNLLNIGVAGFRIDAAKHMASHEIASIVGGLTRTGGLPVYVFQEVIDQGGEPIKSFEYTPNGDVTEFKFSVKMGNVFNCGDTLSSLQNMESGWLATRFAQIFVDNHDNQRGHGAGGACILDHRDGFANYNLGNIFMLAYPYGHPSVMSSYYWSNNPSSNTGDSKGPPSTTAPYISGSGAETRPAYGAGQAAGAVPENCSISSYEDGKWVCEHRRTAIANMVGFRQATAGEAVTDWVNVSSNHIAFGRGNKGYVAINKTGSANTRTYTTGLSAGYYCDITRYDYITTTNSCVQAGTLTPVSVSELIVVEANGQILNKQVAATDAFAIHINAKVVLPQIYIGNGSVTEGNSGTTNLTLPVTLNVASGSMVTVSYAVVYSSATAADMSGATSGVVEFAAGQTVATATVSVVGDTLYEGNETFTVSLSSPVNATILVTDAVGTITDDDAAPQLSIAAAS
ncbi:MAG: pullulanase-type alpha-1,6-glucosidase, partial [Anaerolineae bacterium]|nr:pullulanase-type alpha-1,6-glucosidase [Anaerolineae bacterium]